MDLDRIGKYRVVGKIGQGAMGEVYKAHDPLLNRYVALKTIAPSLATDPDFQARFKREAQSAAQLNHPNIVTVFDFGEEAGLTYMAMELLEGLDLREAIRRRALGHFGRKMEVMQQLCEGLAFAHAHGVVHRDLKPGNIKIQPSGHVKILDFGLARLGASEITRTGTVMGTPHYMSPEQVRGEKADARSDVFSLGALFYEILSGHRAFEADSVHQVLQAILEKEPEPLRRRAPDTPPALAAVTERALAKSPSGRFKDAGEMGQALAQARESLAGETLAAPSTLDEDAERTVLSGAGATVMTQTPGRAGHSVAGANALDVGRAGDSHRKRDDAPGTVRPERTVASGPETEVPSRSRRLLIGGVVLAVAAAAAVGFWIVSRPGPALVPGDAAQETVGILTEALLTSKVELARADLDNRDYRAAADHAREALAIDAGNPEALDVLERAESAGKQLEAAAAEATAAFGRGDPSRASEALGRVLALDPRHPVADELSGELNRFFRGQAEESRGQAARARTGAEGGHATGEANFRRAFALTGEADGLFGRGQYAVAAQKYLESRDAFEAAVRAAETRRAIASPPPSRATPGVPSPSPTAVVQAPLVPPSATAPVPAVPLPAAISTPVPSPAAATTVPSPSPSAALPSRELQDTAAVQRVIDDYVRAIETRDLALFRALMPDLTSDQEKTLRDSFGAIKVQRVALSGFGVQIDGNQATARVSRQDTINGRPMKPVQQTFRLGRQGGSWRILSFAFER